MPSKWPCKKLNKKKTECIPLIFFLSVRNSKMVNRFSFDFAPLRVQFQTTWIYYLCRSYSAITDADISFITNRHTCSRVCGFFARARAFRKYNFVVEKALSLSAIEHTKYTDGVRRTMTSLRFLNKVFLRSYIVFSVYLPFNTEKWSFFLLFYLFVESMAQSVFRMFYFFGILEDRYSAEF